MRVLIRKGTIMSSLFTNNSLILNYGRYCIYYIRLVFFTYIIYFNYFLHANINISFLYLKISERKNSFTSGQIGRNEVERNYEKKI